MALERMCSFNRLSALSGNMNTESAQHKMIQNTLNKNAYTLLAPPYHNPDKRFQKILMQNKIKLNLAHGTTTLGFKYQGGVIICADSRNTVDNFAASQQKKKIIELDKCMLGTISGCAADCCYWHRVLTMECRIYRLQNDNCGMPVTIASRIIQKIVKNLTGMGLSMGLIIAGYDPDGAKLISIDDSGERVEGNLFALGSGLSHAYSVLNNGYSWHMSDQTAYNLARRAAYDNSMSNINISAFIKIYHLTQDGWKIIEEESNDSRVTPMETV